MTVALIVDDNEQNRYLLRQILTASGFGVTEASNGQAALECAEEIPIDLVVSDILMPGMDGFELCRQWKANPRLRAIPFVFYTATYTDPKDESFALSLGADGFFIKPTDPRVLRDRLKGIVGQQQDGTLRRRKRRRLKNTPYLQEYSRILARKLEDKVNELDHADRELRMKDFALTSSESGVVLTNDSSRITWFNPAFERLVGVAEPTLLGQSLESCLRLPPDWNDWTAQGHGARHFASTVEATGSSQGVGVSLQVSAHAVVSDDGERLGFMLSCVDVTEERRLRKELERVQRFKSLGLFAAGVAHDINNILMSMLAGIELGMAPHISDATREQYRDIAMAGVERARDLTRRLLAFSRDRRAERRPVDLKRLLGESILLALSGSSVQCERRFPTEHVSVFADPGQLAQVFSNLLVNARQALRDGGNVVVTLEMGQLPASSTDGVQPGRFVTIRISDDGPGIPADVLPEVFEPYFTTKSDGTGLGLATCHAIVHDHGGRITVSSTVGAGTTFEIWLPCPTESVATRSTSSVPTNQVVLSRILVMEGLAPLRSLLQRALEDAGYSVVTVADGEQALLEHRRAEEEGAAFELVILDVTIHGATGGLETLAELRNVAPDIPILASTGYADESALQELYAKGVTRALRKPFLIPELLGTIGAVLAR